MNIPATSNSTPEPARTCGDCQHWHAKPRQDPPRGAAVVLQAVAAPLRGDCREGPPHATSLPIQDRTGQLISVNVVSSYPDLPETFPACARFQARLALVGSQG